MLGRRTPRIEPFQEKRDADAGHDEWPDPKAIEPDKAAAGEQEHYSSDQKQRASDNAVKGTIPDPIGQAADSHREKARGPRRAKNVPIDCNQAQKGPRQQRHNEPVAERGRRTATRLRALTHGEECNRILRQVVEGNEEKGASWNPNQQAARYTERVFMPGPELVVVARFKVPAKAVLSG